VRIGWLLLSVAVHGAALTVALGFGMYGRENLPAPRVEVRISVPSRAQAQQVVPVPDLVVEAVLDAPLPDGPVVPFAEPEPRALAESEPLPQSTLQRATLDRVRAAERPAPIDVVPPVAPLPVAPQPAPPQPDVDASPRSDNEPPVYPESERLLQHEGTVVVTVAVAADGSVRDVTLHTPARHAAFNREALRAVRRWRFEPARRHGVPVAGETDVTVVFRLRDA
jgi:protein TonB